MSRRAAFFLFIERDIGGKIVNGIVYRRFVLNETWDLAEDFPALSATVK